MSLHVDFETRSAADLKRTGAYAYAADPTTDIWCMAYAFGDGPVSVWTPGQPAPAEIVEHVMLGGVLTAHNAAFERVIWHYVLGPRYGFPEPATTQWRCTMAMAYAMALPGSLENAALAVGLDVGKDMTGRRLMLQMSRPRKMEPGGWSGQKCQACNGSGERYDNNWDIEKACPDCAGTGEEYRKDAIVWWDDPDKLAKLIAYCKQDVEVERALEKRLRPLKDSELALWHLDQTINDRGVLVDRNLCHAAKAIVGETQVRLDRRMREVSGQEITACSNRNQIVAFVRANGIEVDSIAKAQLEELLEISNTLPPKVREVLELRRESAKASVAKIDALLTGASPEDSRAKGLLQFHAATTGRWGGRRFQPQNLKRPEEADIDTAIDVVATGDFDYVSMFYDQPLSVVGDILRGLIVASPGHRIVAADYSNIEGRVLAWLAGEDWKIRAFKDFDEGTGHDLYKLTAGRILNKQPGDINKAERQAYGKVPELALGYQGGVGAFQTMAVNYGVDLTDEEIEGIRDGWREAHPAIKQFWYAMENAAVEAVRSPGSWQSVGRIRFKVAGSFLMMRLPSGRFLAYPYPQIRWFEVPWKNSDGTPAKKEGLTYFSTIDVSKKAKVVDDPKNSATWARIKTYGGMISENATQAVARDVLADAMPRLEAAGYPIILTVHDEIVCEVRDGHGSVSAMEEIMCDLPEWAAGLPVAAEGFEGERYRK